MPVPGTKLKPEGQRRTRHAPTHDWTEVPDQPYTGPKPKLPQRFRTDPETGMSLRVSWPARTKRWWSVVSSMPHASLWTDADWEYALDTCEVHARFCEGTNGTELRIREKLLGVTLDARRDLRIRYVPKAEQARPADVVNMDDYRSL